MNHFYFDQYQRNWVASLESETKILSHSYADIHAGQRIDLLVDHDVDQKKKKHQITYGFWHEKNTQQWCDSIDA